MCLLVVITSHSVGDSMAIHVGTTEISQLNGKIYVGNTEVKKVHAGAALVWEKYTPPTTLFDTPGAGHPEWSYPYGVESLDLAPNILSTYSRLEVLYSFSYYDTANDAMSWSMETINIISYGAMQDMWVELNLTSVSKLTISTISGGPMGGFLHFPKIIQVIGYP